MKNFWKKLKKPVVVMAPMSGVSDEPFRLMFLEYGKPDVFWTEFVSAEGLFSKGRNYCLNILKFSKKERPIVAQLFGSDPVYFEKAARLIAELGFDGVDINMGCPDRDIEKQGAGSALIKNPELAKEIIRAAKKSGLPVSVKTRIGYDKNEIDKWIPMLFKENIAALTVHLRTREELFFSPAHWDLAKEIVKMRDKYSPKTIILGNGDVKSLVEAQKITKDTGIDGIMVGRGLIGKPWFFSGKVPTISDRLKAIIKHSELFDDFHREELKKKDYHKKFASIKKHFHAYTKGFGGARDLREQLMKVKSTAETKSVVKEFLGKK
jgi:nifR3 family TIM-barrel protein